MPYQISTYNPQPRFALERSSETDPHQGSRFSFQGDCLNSVIADLVAFTSIFCALGSAYWFTVLANVPNRLSSAVDPGSGLAVGIIGLLALMIVLTVRHRLTLIDHRTDALVLAAASGCGCLILLVLTSGSASMDILIAGAVAALFGGVSRSLIAVFLHRQISAGHLTRRIAVFGATRQSKACLSEINNHKSKTLIGLFDDRSDVGQQRRFGDGVRGDLSDLLAMAAAGELDEVIIALPAHARNRALAVAKELSAYPLHLRWPTAFAECSEVVGPKFRQSTLGTIELADVQTRPLEGWNLIFKQAQDRLGALVLLALFSPVMALIALAIKLDTAGPVFFRQRRHGLGGKIITVWKFRTMRVLEDGAKVVQASSNDPRVTRVGRILRKTSLDELPQLINVLLGEMSLVGPRPHAIAHNQHYAQMIPTYNGRNRIKPGITGWAQVNGYRGETSTPVEMERRVEHDHWYIRNCSLWLDLKILLLTPAFGLVHPKAY